MADFRFGLRRLPEKARQSVRLKSKFGLTPAVAAVKEEIDTTSPIVVIRDSFTDSDGTWLSRHTPEVGVWDLSWLPPDYLRYFTIQGGHPAVIEYSPYLSTPYYDNEGTGFYVDMILDYLIPDNYVGPVVNISASGSYDKFAVGMNSTTLLVRNTAIQMAYLFGDFTAPAHLKIRFLHQILSVWVNDVLQAEVNYDEFVSATFPWWVGTETPFKVTPSIRFQVFYSFSGLTFFEAGILRE